MLGQTINPYALATGGSGVPTTHGAVLQYCLDRYGRCTVGPCLPGAQPCSTASMMTGGSPMAMPGSGVSSGGAVSAPYTRGPLLTMPSIPAWNPRGSDEAFWLLEEYRRGLPPGGAGPAPEITGPGAPTGSLLPLAPGELPTTYFEEYAQPADQPVLVSAQAPVEEELKPPWLILGAVALGAYFLMRDLWK